MAGYIPGSPSSPDSGRDDVDDSDDVDDGGSGRGSDDRVLTPSSPDEPTSTTGSGSDRGSGYSSDDDDRGTPGADDDDSSSSGTDDRVISPEGLTTTKGAASGATSSGDTTTADGDPASQPTREMNDAVRERNADADASINLADPTARAFIPGLAGDTRAAERQSAEQFGDIETRYLTGGNRRDEDVLADYSDDYEDFAAGIAEFNRQYGPPAGIRKVASVLPEPIRDFADIDDDGMTAGEEFAQGTVDGALDALNPAELALGIKEAGEFVVTQPGRLTSKTGRDEFASDIGERADAIASGAVESLKTNPSGSVGELTGGLTVGIASGTLAGRGLRAVSGGRVGGSDLSGAALKKSVDATRRVKAEVDDFRNAERGQADLTGPSRKNDVETSSVDDDVTVITGEDLAGPSRSSDPTPGSRPRADEPGDVDPADPIQRRRNRNAERADRGSRRSGEPLPDDVDTGIDSAFRRTLNRNRDTEASITQDTGPREVDPSTLDEPATRRPTTGSDLVDPVESFEDLDGGLQQQAQAADVTAAGVGGVAGIGFSGTFGDIDSSPEMRVATDVDQDTGTDLDQDITTDVDEDVDIDQDTDIRTDTDVQTDVDDDTRFDSPTRYDSPETDLRVDTRLDSEARIDAETRSDPSRRRDLDLDLRFGDVEDDALTADLDGFERAITNAVADPEDILSGRAFGRD